MFIEIQRYADNIKQIINTDIISTIHEQVPDGKAILHFKNTGARLIIQQQYNELRDELLGIKHD